MTTEPTAPTATEPTDAATEPAPGTRPEDVTIRRGDREALHYPQAEAHTWNEFAGLAVEMGGYGDLTAVNPWNGDRLHLMWALGKNMEPGEVSFYDALRRLVDAMERTEFLGKEDGSDGGPAQI